MVIGLVTGCSTYIPFSTDIIARYNLSTNDLVHLQYYVSKQVLLHRELASGNASIARGRLVIQNGRSIDEVEVVKYAPGVAASASQDDLNNIFFYHMDVRFAANAPTFPFEAQFGAGHPLFTLVRDGTFLVTFDHLQYEPEGNTLQAILLIDRRTLNKLKSERTIYRGLRLPDTPQN